MSAVVQRSIALLGLGAAARSYLDALPEFPELVVQAVVEPRQVGAPPGARVFTSLADLMRRGPVPDLAIVCTPPALHVELAEPLLRASVDVIVESPLATTPDDADRLSALAERVGRIALTAGPRSALPCIETARQRIAEGAIGRLCHLEVVLGAKRAAGRGWRADPEMAGGGVWMEYGSQALDLLERLAGPVRRIRMTRAESRQGSEVEDEVRVETEHEAGLIGAIRASWNEQPQRPTARCVGERGELVIGQAQTLLRDESGRETVIGSGCDERESARAVLAGFLRALRRPERFVDHGAENVAWIHAAYRGQRDGRWELA